MDHPHLTEFLQHGKRIHIEDLNIEEGDKSRRLGQEALGKAWAVDSPDRSWNIPVWAKGDKLVRQIMNSRSPSPVVDLRLPASPSPSPRPSPPDNFATSETVATSSAAYRKPQPQLGIILLGRSRPLIVRRIINHVQRSLETI